MNDTLLPPQLLVQLMQVAAESPHMLLHTASYINDETINELFDQVSEGSVSNNLPLLEEYEGPSTY